MSTHGSRSTSKYPIDELLVAEEFLHNPYPAYARARLEDPVHWCDPWQCWVLSRYSDVRRVLRQDGVRFSVVGRVRKKLLSLSERDRSKLASLQNHFDAGLLNSDPPQHTRLRSIIGQDLMQRMLDNLRPKVATTVDDILDRLDGSEPVDLASGFGLLLPIAVIGDLLGLPPTHQRDFQVWGADITRFLGNNRASAELAFQCQASIAQARDYVYSLSAINDSVANRDTDDHHLSSESFAMLTPDEIVSTYMTFLVGGSTTTSALVITALWLLLKEPSQLTALVRSPSLLPSAIEEIMRFESPTQRVLRVAKEDTEVNGRIIAAGQPVMLLLGAANRDPVEFKDPDHLDIVRSPNRHFGFAAGRHSCLGAPLARLMAAVALSRILQRFPGLELLEDPVWCASDHSLRILKSLKVKLR